MVRILVFLSVIILAQSPLFSQSLEIMTGNQRLFADVQWLKPLGGGARWTVFSRTRATWDYQNQTDIFTGAYLNYTTRSGLGASIVGKIAGTGTAADIGVHFFRAKPQWMLFGLAGLGMTHPLEYSWFSILRYTPVIRTHWRLYTSLELYALFTQNGHVYSVQRIRIGLDWKGLQFGLGNNLLEFGPDFKTNNNFGGFIRQTF